MSMDIKDVMRLRTGDWVERQHNPKAIWEVTLNDGKRIHIKIVQSFGGNLKVGAERVYVYELFRSQFKRFHGYLPQYGSVQVNTKTGEVVDSKDDEGKHYEAPLNDFIPERKRLQDYFMSKKRLR